jgi:hypothetical protein
MFIDEMIAALNDWGFTADAREGEVYISRNGKEVLISDEVLKLNITEFYLVASLVGDLLESQQV